MANAREGSTQEHDWARVVFASDKYTINTFHVAKYCCAPIAQLVEYEIGNLRVASSPIHPVAKWVPGIWKRLASWLCNRCL